MANAPPPAPSPPATKSISAIVINYNGGEKVVRVIEALATHAPEIAHVLVADNGSTDSSIATIRARFPSVEILELGANLGLPNARNAGLRQVTSDYVLLLDADIYVTPGCVPALLEAAERFEAAVVCPRIILVPDGSVVQCDGAEPHFVGTLTLLNPDAPRSRPPVETGPVRGLIGAAMLLDRRAVLDAGGFNELYFFYLEDLEFSLRMRLLGHDVVRAPTAIVEHEPGQGTVGLSFRGKGSYPPRRAYLAMRNRLVTIALCYSGRTLILLSPVLLAYELATLAFALSRGFLKEWWAGWRWLVAHRAEIGRERRALQARRVRRDRDLLGAGPLPLAKGVIDGPWLSRAVSLFETSLTAYWRLVARWT
jgi:GT2 family glycosyltransferase